MKPAEKKINKQFVNPPLISKIIKIKKITPAVKNIKNVFKNLTRIKNVI
jgi:hypothetical protein